MEETKKIITPVQKHEVIIKTWLTGRERRLLRDIFLEDVNFSVDGRGEIETKSSNTAEIMRKAEDKAIEIIVVSVDGKKKDIIDAVWDMHSDDTDFIMEEIGKIRSGENFPKSETKQKGGIASEK